MIWGYACYFRRREVRVWAQMALKANFQSGKHYPWTLNSLEGMTPQDGLLAGIVCLSLALVGPLREAVVVHVAGNMEDEGLNV